MGEALRLSIKLTGDASGMKGALVVTEKELDKLNKTSSKTTKQSQSLAMSLKNVGAIISGLALGKLAYDLYETGNSINSINNSLEVAIGSASGAKKEWAFLRDEAERLGIVLESSAKQYSSLAAAAKGTALEGENSRKIYVSIVETMTALGRSSFEVEGAIKAVEQMISKGNVQAEELRGQLGERLPGAFQIAAEAMGVTTQELNKMLDNGQVLAEDLLPKLADALHNKFGDAAVKASSQARAEFNRLKNTWFEIQTDIVEGGVADAFADVFREITEGMQTEGFRETAKEIGIGLAEALRTAASSAKFLAEHTEEVKLSLASLVAIKAGSILVDLSKGFLSAASAVRKFSIALASNPIGLVAVAVSTAVASLVLFNDELITVGSNTAELGDYMAVVWGDVKDGFVSLSETISGLPWETISAGASTSFNSVLLGIKNTLKGIYNFAIGLTTTITDMLLMIGDTMAEAFSGTFANMGRALEAVFVGDFKRAGKYAKEAFDTEFLSILSDNMDKWGSKFNENFTKDWAGEAFDNVANIVGNGMDDVATRAAQRYNSRLEEGLGKSSKVINSAKMTWEKLRKEEEKANRRKTQTNKVYGDFIKSLRLENKELEYEIAGKKELIPLLAKEIELKDLTKAQIDEINQLLGEKQSLEDAKEKAEEWQSIWEDSANSVGQTFSESFIEAIADGKANFEDMGNSLIDIFKNVATQITQMLIFQPMVNGIYSSLGLGGYASGGSAGMFSSIAGGLPSLGASAAGSSSLLSGLMTGGSIWGIGQSAALGNFAIDAAQALGVQSAESLALFGNAGLNAGWGAVGSIGANLLGLSSSNMAVDMGLSTVGSLLGGAFGGPIGAALGGFAGSALGGLFGGGSKTADVPAGNNSIYYVDGQFVNSVGGRNGGSGSASVGQSYIEFLQEFMDMTGLQLESNTSQRVGWLAYDKDGYNSGQSYEEAVYDNIISNINNDIFTNVPQYLSSLMEEATNAEETRAAIETWLTAQTALKTSLEAMAEDVSGLTQTETTWNSLIAQFDELETQATSLGVSLSLVAEAEAKQKQILLDQYNETTRLAILAKTNPYQAALEQFNSWADDTRREADLIGADLAQVEQLIELERIDILEQYGDELLASERRISEARKEILNDNLNDFLNELRGTDKYGTSSVDALAYTQNQFNDVRAEALAGSVTAIEDLPNLGKQLIELAEAVYAKNANYYAIRDHVEQSTLDVQGAIPAYAEGGLHSGGWRVVGEEGIELEATGASRIFNHQQTKDILSGAGSNSASKEDIKALISTLQAYAQQSAQETELIAKLLNEAVAKLEEIERANRRSAA